MDFNRRQILVGASATLVTPRFSVAEDADGYVILTAEKAEMSVLGAGSSKTPVWRFQKDQAIAVLRAKQGQVFKGRFINHLDQDIWLHWFGVRGGSDAMTINAAPSNGNSVDIEFTPPDAGTFWFGPLLHASEQRDRGLYGMLIVEEAAPRDWVDVPLIFDDWKIDDQGKPVGKFGDLELAIGEGRFGNWFTLNGRFKSHIEVDGTKPARLRLLNAANARAMRIIMKGAEFQVLAIDGQPTKPSLLEQDSLRLEPGQRIDLLLANFEGQVAIALNVLDDVVDVGFLEVRGTSEIPPDILLPVNPIAVLGDLETVREIVIRIEGGAKGGLKSAKVGDVEHDVRGLLEKGLAWAFNGIAGAGGPPLFEAKANETLVLAFENATSFPQPIHIHGHVWQMIESDGVKIETPIWRDTAVVPGLSKIKLALVADNVGLWVIQSLIAERCDAGLLGAFTVEAVPL
jgi:FtsP/CotA-like multicopper oxidase with cupredoxin domain